MAVIKKLNTVSAYHQFVSLSAPAHPLISLIDYAQVQYPESVEDLRLVQSYYVVGLKRNVPYKFYYGQQTYDFDEGLMTFIAPNQVVSLAQNPNVGAAAPTKPSGWLLLIHPDLLWNTKLAASINAYGFFGYSIHEALFLSEKEEQMIVAILKRIEQEYQANTDRFTQKIITSQLEVLLNYAERFYERQFLTRQKSSNELLSRLDALLTTHFAQTDQLLSLPTVESVSAELKLSANYLSSMLKSLTGMSAQQHIHHRLIEKAKEQLMLTELPVSEIAYQLGFAHPASFSKLFKNKTQMSPREFRQQMDRA